MKLIIAALSTIAVIVAAQANAATSNSLANHKNYTPVPKVQVAGNCTTTCVPLPGGGGTRCTTNCY
jgi:hypothetical protein